MLGNVYFLQSAAIPPLDEPVVDRVVVVVVPRVVEPVVVGRVVDVLDTRGLVVVADMLDMGGLVVVADVLVTGGLVVVGGGLVVAPPEDDTLISVHPENQKPAKSHSQNTVYFPAAKLAGTVTYASV